MADSSIEWTNKTWNPVTGCSKVSPGCAHCYAEALTMRYATAWKVPGLPWTPENAAQNVILKPERLEQPLKWKKPARVFVNSMSDLFHELIPDDYIVRVFDVMCEAQQHTFQILTKRPERMRDFMQEHYWSADAGTGPLPNVWLGTSIENRRFVSRADALRQTPAAVRFISAEPLLGPLIYRDADYYPAIRPEYKGWTWKDELDLTGIDWLIVGGESGKGYRRFDVEWARALRDRCRETGTAFFLKQTGGHRPGDKLEDLPFDLRIREYPVREESRV